MDNKIKLMMINEESSDINVELDNIYSDKIDGGVLAYVDKKYSFELKCNGVDTAEFARIEFSDQTVELKHSNESSGCFHSEAKKFFLMRQGVHKAILHLDYHSRSESYYFNIIVCPKKETEDVQKTIAEMLDCIRNNDKNLIVTRSQLTENEMSMSGQKGEISIIAEQQNIKRIAADLKIIFPYFRTEILDSFSAGYCVAGGCALSAQTINYALSYPDCVKAAEEGFELPGLKGRYELENLYVPDNINDSGLETAQIALDFIFTLRQHCIKRISEIKAQIAAMPRQKLPEPEAEYVLPQDMINEHYRIVYSDSIESYRQLGEKLTKLIRDYRNIADKEPAMLRKLPPVKTLLSKPHHIQLYKLMSLWFSRRTVTAVKDEELIKISRTDTIYEFYSLVNIYNVIIRMGFKEIKRWNYEYSGSLKHHSDIIKYNSFRFARGEDILELFYEPYIYGYEHKPENGVGLCRIGKVKLGEADDTECKNNFLTPDFLIKLSNKGRTVYGVLDAKFRSEKSILNQKCFEVSLYRYDRCLINRDNGEGPEFMFLLCGLSESHYCNLVDMRSLALESMGFAPKRRMGIVKLNPEVGTMYFENAMDDCFDLARPKVNIG